MAVSCHFDCDEGDLGKRLSDMDKSLYKTHLYIYSDHNSPMSDQHRQHTVCYVHLHIGNWGVVHTHSLVCCEGLVERVNTTPSVVG